MDFGDSVFKGRRGTRVGWTVIHIGAEVSPKPHDGMIFRGTGMRFGGRLGWGWCACFIVIAAPRVAPLLKR